MKIAAIFILSLAVLSASAAPTITWDASSGSAEGYRMHCGPTPITVAPVPVDVGAVLSYDIEAMTVIGVESECWVTAYAAAVPDSPDSNHIRITPPYTNVITVLGQPSSVTVTWE